jgi:hypothetical protein
MSKKSIKKEFLEVPYSLMGQRIISAESEDATQTVIDRGTLQSGPYFFEVIADGQKIARGTLIVE